MYDFILVGQGLAGSMLAHQLIERGESIVAIDDGKNSSSNVAAGLINPIVFKRLTFSWKAQECMPIAFDYYHHLQHLFNTNFLNKKELIKLLVDEHEEMLWHKKQNGELANKVELFESRTLSSFFPQHAFGKVKEAAWLDIQLLLEKIKCWLLEKNALTTETFDYSLLEIGEEEVRYKDLAAKRVVFCEGAKASNNPWFPNEAFKLTKGELLTLHIPDFQEQYIINKGVFILPLGNQHYRVGSTYDWDKLNNEATEEGKKTLLEKLHLILGPPYTIIDHMAGVRPTVVDRRPLLGQHPNHKNLFFLNGLGTRGALQGPYLIKTLLNLIYNSEPLQEELNFCRFF